MDEHVRLWMCGAWMHAGVDCHPLQWEAACAQRHGRASSCCRSPVALPQQVIVCAKWPHQHAALLQA